MVNNQIPSEVIQNFLDFLEVCQKECEAARSEVAKEDAKKQDFLHAMEFEENEDELTKIAVQTHLSRRNRRLNKDKVQELEKITAFVSSEKNKLFLKLLRGLIREQKQVEEYLYNERTYIPRAGDIDGSKIQSQNDTEDKPETCV